MNNIERIIQNIKDKYTARMDSRESGRKKILKKGSVNVVINRPLKKSKEEKEFITINHTAVPLDPDGGLGGEIGEKIEKTEKKTDKTTDKTPKKQTFVVGQRSQEELRKYVEDGFKSGQFSESVDWSKQRKHIKGTPEFDKYSNEVDKDGKKKFPSWLTVTNKEIEEIVRDNIHSGNVIEVPTKDGNISYRVEFTYKKEVGKSRSGAGFKIVPVDTGYIHLSKTGVHITPKYYPPKKKR